MTTLKLTESVDLMASETSVADEIDTSTATAPVTIATPSSGKKIDTRSAYLASDSTSGKVVMRFTGGEIIGVIYCSKFALVALDSIRKTGAKDEAVVVDWSGLSTGAKIYYSLRYKEVD